MDTTSVCTPALAAQDRGYQVIAAAFSLWGLAFVTVGLRFLSRHISRAGLWWDDWLMVVALTIAGGQCFPVIPLYLEGFGKHAACAKSDAIPYFLRTLFAWGYVYTLIMVTVKYSILLFLKRLFAVDSFKMYFWMLWVVITLWGIAMIIVSSLVCIPIDALWAEGVRGRCVSIKAFYFGNAIPNIITDVALLVLPIPWIMRLRIVRSIRMSLVGVFGCGALVVVISCYRLYAIVATNAGPDLTYEQVHPAVWTLSEEMLAIVSACLPSLNALLKPLLRACGFRTSPKQSTAQSSSTTTTMGLRLAGHMRHSRLVNDDDNDDNGDDNDDSNDEKTDRTLSPVSANTSTPLTADSNNNDFSGDEAKNQNTVSSTTVQIKYVSDSDSDDIGGKP